MEQIKMNMRSAVLAVESAVNSGKDSLIINSEFGVIGIEFNGFSIGNSLHPAIVFPWKEAPDTDWALKNADKTLDYYASIDIIYSEISDHLAIIEALTRCMFLNLGCKYPDDGIIDAAVLTYIKYYDDKELTVNSLVHEFTHNHLNIIARNMDDVVVVVRELIENRISVANSIITKSNEFFNEYKNNTQIIGEFYDKYCEKLFSIALYSNDEQKKEIEKTSNNLTNFELTEKVCRPTTLTDAIFMSANIKIQETKNTY